MASKAVGVGVGVAVDVAVGDVAVEDAAKAAAGGLLASAAELFCYIRNDAAAPLVGAVHAVSRRIGAHLRRTRLRA